MFDDLLGKDKENSIQPTQEELIEAMEYNIKKKRELIDNLLKKITELEKEVERLNSE